MIKVSGNSGYTVYFRRVFPFVLALVACLIWVSAAHAQTTPFNSQYDPPPTTPPPECGTNGGNSSGSGGTGDPSCDPQEVSNSDGQIEILPATGGFGLATVLLGVTLVGAAGILAVRRRR